MVRCHELDVEQRMIGAIDDAKESGDTVGGVFQVVASGTPIGLGSHVHWDRKLDANLAQAMMSINAVKGVEIGPGFEQAQMVGSLVHDVIRAVRRVTGAEVEADVESGGGHRGRNE